MKTMDPRKELPEWNYVEWWQKLSVVHDLMYT